MPAPQDQAGAQSGEGTAPWRWAFLLSDAMLAALLLGGGGWLAIRWWG